MLEKGIIHTAANVAEAAIKGELKTNLKDFEREFLGLKPYSNSKNRGEIVFTFERTERGNAQKDFPNVVKWLCNYLKELHGLQFAAGDNLPRRLTLETDKSNNMDTIKGKLDFGCRQAVDEILPKYKTYINKEIRKVAPAVATEAQRKKKQAVAADSPEIAADKLYIKGFENVVIQAFCIGKTIGASGSADIMIERIYKKGFDADDFDDFIILEQLTTKENAVTYYNNKKKVKDEILARNKEAKRKEKEEAENNKKELTIDLQGDITLVDAFLEEEKALEIEVEEAEAEKEREDEEMEKQTVADEEEEEDSQLKNKK